VLCELIFATLIISDKAFEMLSTIRMYIYGAIAAVGLFLIGILKYLSNKNDKLEKELKTEKHNAVVKDTIDKKEKDIQQALSDVQKESQKVHDANTKNRINKVRPNVGDSFNDTRLK
jgi:glucose-6-phosphate-specific signal transduction histidine kinase